MIKTIRSLRAVQKSQGVSGLPAGTLGGCTPTIHLALCSRGYQWSIKSKDYFFDLILFALCSTSIPIHSHMTVPLTLASVTAPFSWFLLRSPMTHPHAPVLASVPLQFHYMLECLGISSCSFFYNSAWFLFVITPTPML